MPFLLLNEFEQANGMKKLKLVMIGNGMAGVRTLEELLKLTNELYDITVFGAEPHPNYNRILLSPVLTGEQQFEEIVLNDLNWYAENGIHLKLNRKVVKIDRIKRRVIADDGSEAEYDRLLIATGSNPFILPIPGKDLQGVIGYRDIADTRVMMETAKTHKHAVVIGGGLLGLEAANGLKLRGMDVTVVHIGDWLMERQLDRTAGTLLQSALEGRGLKFLLPKQTAELLDNGDGRVCAVEFKDGEVIPADLVVMAAGIRPNSELAEQSGIACNRGILVNDTLQTYDPRVYAIGECASHRGIAYGLVAPLFEQAKVCANHLAMLGFSRYLGSVTSTKLKVTGIDLFSAGDFIGGDGTETITLSDPIGGVYKKLVIKDDVLVGACLYGDTADGGWYFRQVREGQNVAQIRDHLMFGAAGLGEGAIGDAGHQGQSKAMSMPDDMEVCGCNGVCKGTIVKAIQEHGLFSVDEVKKHTKAASSCGSCAGLVEQILINTVGGAADVKPKSEKAICGCSDLNHGQVRKAIREHHLTSIPAAMAFMEWRTPNGCATCRPALNYYLISTWPGEAKDDPQSRFINERAHANIQKDGTYSVIPRMWGGVTNAAELRRIADVADKYQVPMVKVTGGQRIDLLGIRKEYLPGVWKDLRHALRPRLRQIHPHREDLRRQRVLPLRYAEQHADGH
ncbi:Nitrite reductase large subunit OS=Stutzerimonas stutzeri OX=316 GN=CXK91_20670 PE=4 SV=1 [Stutzerimonas stutzeri]